jgi:hypothetical protein
VGNIESSKQKRPPPHIGIAQKKACKMQNAKKKDVRAESLFFFFFFRQQIFAAAEQ